MKAHSFWKIAIWLRRYVTTIEKKSRDESVALARAHKEIYARPFVQVFADALGMPLSQPMRFSCSLIGVVKDCYGEILYTDLSFLDI